MILNKGLQRQILDLILNGQVKDVVIEDAKTPTNMMDFIAMALTAKQQYVNF